MFDLTTKFQAFVEFQAIDKLSKTLNEIQGLSNRTKVALTELADTSFYVAYEGAKLAAWIGALSAPLGFAIYQATEFERVFIGEFNKVVGLTGRKLEEFKNFFLELSEQIPLTATEIAQLSAGLAQMGIPTNQLKEFTRLVAQASFAFDMMAEEAGKAFGEIRNAFGIKTVSELREVGDAINYLSNTMGASASDLVEILKRVGASAKLLGLSAKSVAVFSATIREAGYQPELVSSALNILFQRLATFDDKTKSVVQTLGWTSQEFQNLLKSSPERAIIKLLDTLKGLESTKKAQLLKELVGAEHFPKIAVLLNNLDKLRGKIDEIAKGKHLGSMSQEVQGLLQTTSAQLEILRNKLQNIAIAIGSILLPPFNLLLSVVSFFITPIARFINAHKTLASAILLPAMAIGGLLVALGVFAIVLGMVGQAVVKGVLALIDLKNAFTDLKDAIRNQIPILRVHTSEVLRNVKALFVWMATGRVQTPWVANLSFKLASLRLQMALVIQVLKQKALAFLGASVSLKTYKTATITLINILRTLGLAFRFALIQSLRFAFSPVGLVLLGLGLILYALWVNIEKIKRAFSGLWNSFKTFFILERLQPLWEGFKIGLIWAKEGIEALKEAFKPLIDAFSNLISAIFGVNTAVGKFNEGAFKGWLEAGVSAGRALAEVFNLLAKTTALFLKPLITGLSFLINLIAKVIEWFKKFSNNPFVQIGITIATLVIPFFALFRVLKLIRLGAIGVRFAILGISYAIGVVIEGFRWLWGIITGIWNWFKETFFKFGDFLALSAIKGYVKVKEAVSSAVSFITSLLSKAFSLWWSLNPFRIIYEGWKKAIEFLKGINLFEIGKNIIEGFVKGLKSVITKPVETVKSIGSKIVSGFKSLLGIKSPSVLFMRLGQFLIQGLSLGIAKLKDKPLRLVNEFGERLSRIPVIGGLVEKLKKISLPKIALDLGLEAGAETIKGSIENLIIGQGIQATNGQKTVIINKVVDKLEVIINGEVKGTPKEIAKEVGEELETKLADLLMRLV